ATLRRRLHTVALQHVGDGPATDAMIEIGKRSLDSCVSPTGIVLPHADDQLRNLARDRRPTWTAAVHEIPLLRDQSPVPPQQRVRRDDRIEFQQRLPSNGLGLAGKEHPFSIGEPKSLASELLFSEADARFGGIRSPSADGDESSRRPPSAVTRAPAAQN